MRNRGVGVLFLVFLCGPVAVAQESDWEVVPNVSPAAGIYAHAYRAQALPDGSRVVIYRSPVAAEQFALPAAIIEPNGEVQRIAASNWIPTDEIATGTLGQIYAVAMSPDRQTLAVSIGWRHPQHGGTNAIAILRRQGASWRLSHLIRNLGAAGDLLLTRDGRLLATTANRERGKALGTPPPMVTLLSLDGIVLEEAFPSATSGPDLEVFRNRSRLGVSGALFTFFDAERGEVVHFKLDREAERERRKIRGQSVAAVFPSRAPRHRVLNVVRTTRLGELQAGSSPDDDGIIEDVHVFGNGAVAVVRSFVPDQNQGVGTLVTIENADGRRKTWHPKEFWSPVFFEGERLIGVSRGATPDDDLIVHIASF